MACDFLEPATQVGVWTGGDAKADSSWPKGPGMNRHSLADHEGARDNVRVSATATTVRKAPSHRYRHAVSPVRSCNYCNIGRTRRRMSSQQVPGVDHCTRCIPMLYRSPSGSRKPSRTMLCTRRWPVLVESPVCREIRHVLPAPRVTHMGNRQI